MRIAKLSRDKAAVPDCTLTSRRQLDPGGGQQVVPASEDVLVGKSEADAPFADRPLAEVLQEGKLEWVPRDGWLCAVNSLAGETVASQRHRFVRRNRLANACRMPNR